MSPHSLTWMRIQVHVSSRIGIFKSKLTLWAITRLSRCSNRLFAFSAFNLKSTLIQYSHKRCINFELLVIRTFLGCRFETMLQLIVYQFVGGNHSSCLSFSSMQVLVLLWKNDTTTVLTLPYKWDMSCTFILWKNDTVM